MDQEEHRVADSGDVNDRCPYDGPPPPAIGAMTGHANGCPERISSIDVVGCGWDTTLGPCTGGGQHSTPDAFDVGWPLLAAVFAARRVVHAIEARSLATFPG
jgi:hypothetical protein